MFSCYEISVGSCLERGCQWKSTCRGIVEQAVTIEANAGKGQPPATFCRVIKNPAVVKIKITCWIVCWVVYQYQMSVALSLIHI